ncbi:MAG: DegV family protein [Clostridiales bacterium]|nr:DegV family protein [Clostridiales bacterium]
MGYILASDATFDLPMELVTQYNIAVVPMAFNLDGEEILHYPDERNMSTEAFYQALKDGKTSTTSQINPMTYVEFFTPYLEKGEDILYIAFTSGLSGTYQSALLAKDMLLEDFPERTIEVVDSLCASAGQGFLLYLVGKKKEEGMELLELVKWTESIRGRVAHFFTVDDLFHLNKGGRLSTAEAIMGTALKIKPIISVDKEGKLYVENKVRGNKKAQEYMISKVNETWDDSESTIFIGHGDAKERAEELRDKILEKTNVKDIVITKIGPIIGTHTGPGMLAVLFLEKE